MNSWSQALIETMRQRPAKGFGCLGLAFVTVQITFRLRTVGSPSSESPSLVLLNPFQKCFLGDPYVRKQFHELLQDIGAGLLPTCSQSFGVDGSVEREKWRSTRLRRTVAHTNLPTESNEFSPGEWTDLEADVDVLTRIECRNETRLEHEKVNFGGIWHSDTTYLENPPMGSMLLSREVPPYGGDTLFASQYKAYEALSDVMKNLLAGLTGISSSARADVSKTREDRIKSDGKEDAPKEYRAEHPVVRTHPETGRKALFVNVAHTASIKGMTTEESMPLLAFLFQHQVKPEFTCRFVWEPNAIAFWDNRCVQHNPVNDYNGFRRIMHRITLQGDKPV